MEEKGANNQYMLKYSRLVTSVNNKHDCSSKKIIAYKPYMCKLMSNIYLITITQIL